MSSNKYNELFDKAKLDSSVKDKIEEKIFAMNFKVEVGEIEKHDIEFVFNRFWGYVVIKVDGKTYKREIITVWLKQTRLYEFTIGDDEKHDVRISLVRSAIPIGSRQCTAWVFVDNKLKGQFDRSLTWERKRYRDMKRLGKITFLSSTILVLAILAFVITYHMPISIDEELNGILFRAGTSEQEYLQPIRITIKGEYYRNMFLREPYRFEGSVHVYEQEKEIGADSQQHDSVSRINIGVPVIRGSLESVRTFIHWIDGGIFYMKPDASAFMIIVFERESNGEVGPAGGRDGLYYVGPCNTREEALEIINELFQLTRGKKASQIE